MNLTHIFLLLIVISCFLLRYRAITIFLSFLTLLAALYLGNIDFYGITALIIFYGLTYLYFHEKLKSKAVKVLLFMIILFLAACLMFHVIPGFKNTLVLNKISVSPASTPYSMFLNLDKVMAGIILFVNSNLYREEKPLDKKAVIMTSLILLACLILFIPGLFLKFIQFDLKIPDILFIWSLNNLFFVCFSEEVFYRGTIQKQLEYVFKNQYAALILTSIIFGMTHYLGGISYVILATVAGIFYGLAYQLTRRLSSSIMVHFGLNLTHLIFFTYPAAMIIN